MTAATGPVTYEEFLALPDPPEGHLELLAGEVVCVAGGDSDHGTVIGNVTTDLSIFVRTNGLGRMLSNVNFHLQDNPPWAPVPDVAFATHARYKQIYRAGKPFDGAPDLAVEVVSKTNRVVDLAGKVQAYIRAGAARVWVIEPTTQTVTVHRPDWTARTLQSGEVLTSDDAGFSVPGFSLPVSDLFA